MKRVRINQISIEYILDFRDLYLRYISKSDFRDLYRVYTRSQRFLLEIYIENIT